MPVTADEMIRAMQTDFGGTLSKIGVTADVLARQLKAELKAKETRFIKVKRGLGGGESDGQVAPEGEGGTIKRGRPKGAPRIVFNGGGLGGDTVIAVDTIAWGVRQAARIDAQKLMGAYPSEKVDHKHSGTIVVNTGITRPMDTGAPQATTEKAPPGASSQADFPAGGAK